ncbi:2Fe-2S iron-sulfur cluster-binding protein [Bdellovibrionota bacterium]
MSEDTFKFSIDNVEIEGKKGETILQSALRSGKKFDLPFYCWHEELSSPAQCRICQVEVDGWGKLVTSCSTPANPDMKVSTKSDKVKAARAGVMELYLLNHPLDCPICDKGGECKLQDYTMRYHLKPSAFTHHKIRRAKHKNMGRVIYDAERCIVCTRCTRFDEEVVGDSQIGVVNRGVGLEIDSFDGGEVTHNFSGNFADLCPVGAWTTKDYRFKSRPWQLTKIDSPCTTCSNGCQAVYWQAKNKLHRITAGKNSDINKRWICDKGREGYHLYNNVENRYEQPMVRGANGEFEECSWEEAARIASEILRESKSPAVFTTNLVTNEAANSLKDLAKDLNSSLNGSDNSALLENWQAVVSKGMAQKGSAINHSAKRFVVVGLDLWETTPIFAVLSNKRKRDEGLVIEEVASLDKVSSNNNPTLLIIGEKELGDKSFSQKLDELKNKGVTEILPLFEGCNPRGLLESGITPFGSEVQGDKIAAGTALFLASDLSREKSFLPQFKQQLSNLDKLILLDDVSSPMSEFASVILPTRNFAMSFGGISTFDNQSQVMKQVLQPTGAMKSVEEIVSLLSAHDHKHQEVPR